MEEMIGGGGGREDGWDGVNKEGEGINDGSRSKSNWGRLMLVLLDCV